MLVEKWMDGQSNVSPVYAPPTPHPHTFSKQGINSSCLQKIFYLFLGGGLVAVLLLKFGCLC